jgi:hypothetical protein
MLFPEGFSGAIYRRYFSAFLMDRDLNAKRLDMNTGYFSRFSAKFFKDRCL